MMLILQNNQKFRFNEHLDKVQSNEQLIPRALSRIVDDLAHCLEVKARYARSNAK